MKLLERDNAVLIPRAVLGLAKGAMEVFIKPAISDLAKKAMRNVYIPEMSEVNTHLEDCVRQEDEFMREAA